MMKIVRVRNRVYRDAAKRAGLKSHAEYAIVIEGATVAHVLKLNAAWIAVEGHDEKRFGLCVSPLNLTRIRELRKWALEKWSQNRGAVATG